MLIDSERKERREIDKDRDGERERHQYKRETSVAASCTRPAWASKMMTFWFTVGPVT